MSLITRFRSSGQSSCGQHRFAGSLNLFTQGSGSRTIVEIEQRSWH